MLFPVEQMSPKSKLWIYAFNQTFTKEQRGTIEKKLVKFIEGWQSHKKEIKANFFFRYEQFIFIVADTTEISGCGIDASSRIIDNLQRTLWLAGNDKNLVYYYNVVDNHEEKQISFIPRYQLQSAIENNLINRDTTIFNNGIDSLEQYLNNNWEISIQNSWLADKILVEAS